MLLNLPPTPDGLLHEKDVDVLAQLGNFIREAFDDNIARQAYISSCPEADVRGNTIQNVKTEDMGTFFENREGKRELEITLEWEEERELTYLVMKEAIQFSQRVEHFTVSYVAEDSESEEDGGKTGVEKSIYDGTVIGRKKIVPMQNIKTKKLIIRITDARVAPILSFVGVYGK